MPTYNGKYQKTYNLKKDHAEIKKQIKEWEGLVDKLAEMMIDENIENEEIHNTINFLSQEMMAINI